MGAPKLALSVRGRPVLAWTADSVEALTGMAPLVVVPPSGPVWDVARRLGLRCVVNPLPEGGIGGSLAVAAQATGKDALMIFLGDEPWPSKAGVQAVLEALGQHPTAWAIEVDYRGCPGHPLLLRKPLLSRAQALTGDRGARSLTRTAPQDHVVSISIDETAPPDLDTHQDYVRLLAEWPQNEEGTHGEFL